MESIRRRIETMITVHSLYFLTPRHSKLCFRGFLSMLDNITTAVAEDKNKRNERKFRGQVMADLDVLKYRQITLFLNYFLKLFKDATYL